MKSSPMAWWFVQKILFCIAEINSPQMCTTFSRTLCGHKTSVLK